MTEGGRKEVLVHAGTQLPVTKTFSGGKQFYLSKAGQQEITVPIYVGHEEPRRRASTLTMDIKQPRLRQSHPVEVELTINEDKISRWRFRPAGFDWCDARDVANPWIGEEPSDQVEKLQAAGGDPGRRGGRGKAEAPVLVAEALAAARAGFKEEGLRLIEDVLDEYPNDADAWNTKGLIHGMRGEPGESVKCYELASGLAPNDLVYRGNYGVALHRVERHAESVEVMRDALSRDRTLTYLHSWLARSRL